MFFSDCNSDKERHTDRDLCCLRSRETCFPLACPSLPSHPPFFINTTANAKLLTLGGIAQPPYHFSICEQVALFAGRRPSPVVACVELLCEHGRFLGHIPLTPWWVSGAQPIRLFARRRGG